MPLPDLGQRLRERWHRQMGLLGLSAHDQTFDAIIRAYSEPHRQYHTLSHLQTIFDQLDTVSQALAEPARAWMAAWYHDIIYDTKAADNEVRSAQRAETELTEIGLDQGLVTRIAALIRATADHQTGGSDAEDNLFLDIDFSILGAKADIYDAYARAVRSEYAWVPDDTYKAGRGDFLEQALAKNRLFLTDEYEQTLAIRARKNMTRELNTLRAAI